jgi:tight adherence protein C
MSGLSPTFALTFTLLVIVAAFAIAYAIRNGRRGLALERLGLTEEDDVDPNEVDEEPFGGGLRRWLGLAGFRSPSAPAMFLAACGAAIAVGALLAAVCAGSGALSTLVEGIDKIPGEFGQVLVPLVNSLPWLIVITFAALPALVVRSSRRAIVEDCERELPVMLELFATLAEAGLGFDAAIGEILESDQGQGRLCDEFRAFQRETLSGVQRVKCLRRLARRVDVPTFSTFVSSLVHAEQGGLGLTDVLRIQADDMRNRRREAALMKAQALPVKLVFPLVICFLPALFVFTLGPAFYSFLQVTNAVTGNIQSNR